MKTATGYLEIENAVAGANDLRISIIERLPDASIREAVAVLSAVELEEFVERLVKRRGIKEELEKLTLVRLVDKIVEKIVEVVVPCPLPHVEPPPPPPGPLPGPPPDPGP